MTNLLQSLRTELYQALAKHDALTLMATKKFYEDRNNNRPEIFCIETEYDRETVKLLSEFKEMKEAERTSIVMQYRAKATLESWLVLGDTR